MVSVQAMYPGSYSCIHVVTSHTCSNFSFLSKTHKNI